MRDDNKLPNEKLYKVPTTKKIVKKAAPKSVKVKKAVTKPVIHNIVISDKSGSMDVDNKYLASNEGVAAEIDALRADTNADYLWSYVEFSDSHGCVTHSWATPVNETKYPSFLPARGGTPLYQTITNIIRKLKSTKDKNIKVLKIFTDGEDTDSWTTQKKNELRDEILRLINEEKWVITFCCTANDKFRMINLGIPENNILVHNNTHAGIVSTNNERLEATRAFSSSLMKGVSLDELKINYYNKNK